MSRPVTPSASSSSPLTPPYAHSKVMMYAEWLALRGMIAVLRRGSFKRAAAIAKGIAFLGYHLVSSSRQWATKNLELVFGDSLNPVQRRALAKIAYGNIALSYLESFRAEEIRSTVDGNDHFWQAYAKGKGVLLCSVHLGSWEAGAYRMGMAGVPTVAVYRPVYNPLSNQEILRARRGVQVEWVESTDLDRIVRALHHRKAVILMTDLNYPAGGVMANFLGIPASCPPGPAKMALLFGTPIIPVVSLRTGIGESMIHMLPQVQMDDLRGEKSVVVLTERLNRAFEPWIINYAEQYYWIYARWRVRPDGRDWTLNRPLTEIAAERRDPPHAVPSRVMDLLPR